jgi:GTP-binding protein
MGEPLPISATHNLNVDVLCDRIADLTEHLSESVYKEPDEDTITVSILGRQNAGKSTLFNALVGDHRAIVSDIPGTTRDAIDTTIEIDGTKFLFIDTAGLKKRTRVTEPVDFYATLRTDAALARSEIALLLIDCTEGVTDTDLKIAGFIQKAARGCIFIASKWDESDDKRGQRAVYTEHLRKKAHFLTHAPVVFTSGLKNEGIDEVFRGIIAVHGEFKRRLPTNEWNQALEDAVTFRPPPTQRGKRLKLNYITQIKTAPPTVTIFVNQPEFLRDQYKRYLERFFRRRFGFDGSPIVFHIRKKRSSKGSSGGQDRK